MKNKFSSIVLISMGLVFAQASASVASGVISLKSRMSPGRSTHQAESAAPFLWYVRIHEVGNLQVGMANFGGIGWGGLNCSNEFRAGVHFPSGSRNAFLGADIWIGGVVEGDTLVSVTWDPDWVTGHGWTQEFHTSPYPLGQFTERTTLDKLSLGEHCDILFETPGAISEHDLITVAWDTTTDVNRTSINRHDGRPHRPMGLELRQKSFSWSFEYARDFVIIEYTIKNVGRRKHGRVDTAFIENIFMGVLGWGGVYYDNRGFGNDSIPEVQDDFMGYQRTTPLPGHPELLDTLDLIWIADNDGNPQGATYGRESIPHAFGLRLLKAPQPGLIRSFNWWVGHRNPQRDWGPQRVGSPLDIPTGGRGWPLTDVSKYQLMSNGEIDYEQSESAISHEGDGWLPPHPDPIWAEDIANGQHAWGMLSVGPFDLAPGDSISFAVAAIGGENFHSDPNNYRAYFDASDPEPFLSRLNFIDLIRNAQWAAWIYDSPGLDTDGDGFAGEYYLVGKDTLYYRGDGIPDFKGPPPPPSPRLSLRAERGRVLLRWNGERSETELDPFSNRSDFEGYRVYMSRTGRDNDYSFLSQRDRINFSQHTWNARRQKWEMKDPPLQMSELSARFDAISLQRHGFLFHPDSFSVADLSRALLEIIFDPDRPTEVDSVYRYFGPFGANRAPDDADLIQAVSRGIDITDVIRRVYPDASLHDSAYRPDGSYFNPYYEYEYAMTGLQVSEPVLFAVTAFDHGDPQTGVVAQESHPTVNAQEVWPIASSATVRQNRSEIGVYPNPYHLRENYNAQGWENARGREPDPERARQITFYNIPDTCKISIWSLDGDLVRRMEHREHPSNSDASVHVWNLISRNTQAVKTGLYIWSVESRLYNKVGKLVIIK